jgi:hypothetical protein
MPSVIFASLTTVCSVTKMSDGARLLQYADISLTAAGSRRLPVRRRSKEQS